MRAVETRQRPLNLAEVLNAAFPTRYHQRIVAVLQAFLDASEDGAGRCVTVAGFVGSIPGWCAVQERWQGVRDRLGVDFFHMTDFMATPPRPPYNKLDRGEKTALMVEHGKLIGQCLMFGVSTSLNLRDFYALSDSDRELFDNNPRGACLANCLGFVSKLFEEKWQIDESVLYVIETGGRGEAPFVEAMLNLFKEDDRVRDVLRVFSVMPVSKKSVAGLDTADIYAWLANQHALKYSGVSQERTPYLNMIEVECESNYMYGDGLLAIRDELRDIQNERQAAGVPPITLFGRLAARRRG